MRECRRMRNVSRIVAIIICSTAIGCGGSASKADAAAIPDAPVSQDAPPTPDAPATPDATAADAGPSYDFSCMATPWPTTVPNPLLLGGVVGNYITGTPTQGALVE